MKSPYTFLWSNHQTHFTIEMNLNALLKLRHILWNQLNNVISVSRNNRIFCYHSNKDLEEDGERSKLFLNPEYTKKFFQEVDGVYNQHQKLLKMLKETSFSELSNEELFLIFNETASNWSQVISYFRASQAQTTLHLNKEVEKQFSGEQLSTLMLPSELDPVDKELLDWQKLLQEEFSVEKLIEHTEKHPWIVAVHFSKEDVIDTLTQRYNNDEENIKVKNILEEKRELKEKQEKIINTKPEAKQAVEFVQKVALSRIDLKSCWAGTDFYLIPLFEEISKRTGESIQDINKYYLINEIRELLNGTKLSNEEKKNRKNCFVGMLKEGKIIFKSGDEAEQLAKQELKNLYKEEETDELKGRIANAGKLVGKARILESNNIEQLRELRKSFQKGEILVTQMTQPNVMDIAMKAGAIVTDEGGMLSHAAIISREFGIPCVVGTERATTTFKEGELIEVDAENEVVRRLNIDLKKYSNLFRGKFNISCFNHEAFAGTSLGRGNILLVQNSEEEESLLSQQKGEWYTFMDKSKKEECLQEGLKLFSSKKKYQEYAKTFRSFLDHLYKDVFPKYDSVPEEISKEELKVLLEKMRKFWYYYGFTEFPYIDLAYQKMQETNDQTIKENLNDMYELKVWGRQTLNKIAFVGGIIPNTMASLSKKYYNDEDSANYLYSNELMALYDGKKVDEEIINKRKKATALISIDGKTFSLSHEKATQLSKEVIKGGERDSINGTIANKGKVTGKVTIAPMMVDTEEVSKINSRMEKGDILIAQTTSPELMVLCHKASAIVSDQGGMMSHAAVVSREFGIPCIVGTEYGTEIFKDGDLVEVDANKGTVKKINKIDLPTEQQCQELFQKYKVPENIKQHCEKVREVAVFLANKLSGSGVKINVELVSRAALLHDLFKITAIDINQETPFHNNDFTPEQINTRNNLIQKYPGLKEDQIAYEFFKPQYPELAETILNCSNYYREKNWEDLIVAYADSVTFQNKVVSHDQRYNYLKQHYNKPLEYWEYHIKKSKEYENQIFSKININPIQLAEEINGKRLL